ncbi:hypothetical protein ElyMa_005512600 [Elysia marginata]|uniref:Uncharacterized protein n=1 Tax=Elysia marginata TaxID=1093978 RepID=A0AAV4EVE3_9GAST|nr:hypothetical protein ElyMa_005512600 [Elysia marginata]
MVTISPATTSTFGNAISRIDTHNNDCNNININGINLTTTMHSSNNNSSKHNAKQQKIIRKLADFQASSRSRSSAAAFECGDRLCGLAVRHSLRDREVRGSIAGRVTSRTLKLVSAAAPPSVWHYGFNVKSGWLGVVHASAPYITVWQHAFSCPKRRL